MPRQSIKRGTWRPAAFIQCDHTIVVALLCALALVRAVDYLTPPTYAGTIEETGPVWLWSIALAIGVAALGYGAKARRHFLVWLGHGWLGTLYAGITVVAFLDAYSAMDGWRRVGPVLVVCLLHWLYWLRTGPRPIDHDHPTATITGGADA